MSNFTAGDTAAEWVEDIPDIVTDEIRLRLHRKHQRAYIFYRRHKWGADCYCTHCLTRYEARYDAEQLTPTDTELYELAHNIRHNVIVMCPLCGAEVTAKSEGYGRRRLWEWHPAAVWSADADGQTVYVVCGEIYGGFSRQEIGSRRLYSLSIDELEANYGGAEWGATWVIRLRPGEVRAVRVSCYRTVTNKYTAYSDNDLKEPWDYGGSIYSIHHYTEFLDMDILKNTFLRYAYAEYLYNDVSWFERAIKFMEYSAVYPSVEMLCKTGFYDVVQGIIDYNVHCRREVDLSGKKPAEIFRLDSSKAAELMRYARDTSDREDTFRRRDINMIAVLKMWRVMRRFNPKTKVEDAEDFCERIHADMVLDSAYIYGTSFRMTKNEAIIFFEKYSGKTKVSPVKLANYLDKHGISGILYRDYIKECETLGYDLTDSIINRPRDFAAAHERTSAANRARIIEEEEKRADKQESSYRKKIYPKLLETFAYTDGKYSIVVPVGAGDIIDEGKQQRNCVAGYAERHITGAVIILFLRRNAEIGRSFGTLEIGRSGINDTYYFRQAYAANNKNLPKDAKQWLDKWLDMVNTKTEEKKNKNRIAVTA